MVKLMSVTGKRYKKPYVVSASLWNAAASRRKCVVASITKSRAKSAAAAVCAPSVELAGLVNWPTAKAGLG